MPEVKSKPKPKAKKAVAPKVLEVGMDVYFCSREGAYSSQYMVSGGQVVSFGKKAVAVWGPAQKRLEFLRIDQVFTDFPDAVARAAEMSQGQRR